MAVSKRPVYLSFSPRLTAFLGDGETPGLRMTLGRTRFETALSVRPDDIDMNQHVHASRYHDYVLAARYDQMARCYQMAMEEKCKEHKFWMSPLEVDPLIKGAYTQGFSEAIERAAKVAETLPSLVGIPQAHRVAAQIRSLKVGEGK